LTDGQKKKKYIMMFGSLTEPFMFRLKVTFNLFNLEGKYF